MDIWVPLKKIDKKKLNQTETGREVRFFSFYFISSFSSLASLFDIRKSDRRISSEQERKDSTQRGLRVGTKNMGFRRVFN